MQTQAQITQELLQDIEWGTANANVAVEHITRLQVTVSNTRKFVEIPGMPDFWDSVEFWDQIAAKAKSAVLAAEGVLDVAKQSMESGNTHYVVWALKAAEKVADTTSSLFRLAPYDGESKRLQDRAWAIKDESTSLMEQIRTLS